MKTFLNHLTDTLEHGAILELARYGADGGWPGLTYTHDLNLLWDEFQDEILEALIIDAQDLGYGDIGAYLADSPRVSMLDSVDGFKGLMVWCMAEREALRYADACENEEGVV